MGAGAGEGGDVRLGRVYLIDMWRIDIKTYSIESGVLKGFKNVRFASLYVWSFQRKKK